MSNTPVTEKLIVIITKVSSFFALISLFSMMLLITLDVTLNKLAGRPIPGTIEVTSYYFMVFVVFLTLPYLDKNEAHISLAQAIKSTKSLETAMSNFTFYIWPARWGVTLGLVSAITVIVLLLAQRLKNNLNK